MSTKERPILFSAPMARAILDGTKTQTRRAVKLPLKDRDFGCELAGNEVGQAEAHRLCPYGQPGDGLWVRETWQHSNFPLGPYDDACTVFYRADYLDDPHGPDGEKSAEGKYRTWIPSIHMYRSASRILLEVTDVRVERLQDISEADAIDEGIGKTGPADADGRRHFGLECSTIDEPTASRAYRLLWESINGAASWAANPWVWVVEFKRGQA